MNIRTKTGAQIERKELIKTGQKIEMKLNTESEFTSGLLIQRLTELYDDPIKATVRETTSNALDSTSEMGADGTVEIQGPTELNQTFTVKDNGCGMTKEEIVNVYSKYGASTKRENFSQVGAFGLGAKAPLAYTNQFTVTSIKEGFKTSVLVRKEEMTNYIEIVSHKATNEPSGTEVSIPVKSSDIHSFNEAISVYEETPKDYSCKVIINDLETKGAGWKLSSQQFEIMDGVKSRVWIESEKRTTLTKVKKFLNGDFNLSFVLGGWNYNDTSLNFYNDSNKLLITVELPVGVLSFNSSRDSILKDDKYTLVKEKLDTFVKSHLMQDLKEYIYNLDLKVYISFLEELLNKSRVPMMLSKGSFNLENEFFEEVVEKGNKHLKENPKTILNKINNLPSKKFAMFSTRISTNYGPSELYYTHFGYNKFVFNSFANNKEIKSSDLDKQNISNINGDDEENFVSAMFNFSVTQQIVSQGMYYNNQGKSVFLTVNDEEDIEKVYSKVKRNRSTIFSNVEALKDSKGIVNFIVTACTKEELENLSLLKEKTSVIIDSSILFKNNEKKKKKTKAKTIDEIEASIPVYYIGENNSLERTKLSTLKNELKPNKKVVFLIKTNPYYNLGTLKRTKIAYCNSKRLQLDEVEFVLIQTRVLSKELEAIHKHGGILLHEKTELRNTKNLHELTSCAPKEEFIHFSQVFSAREQFILRAHKLSLKKLDFKVLLKAVKSFSEIAKELGVEFNEEENRLKELFEDLGKYELPTFEDTEDDMDGVRMIRDITSDFIDFSLNDDEKRLLEIISQIVSDFSQDKRTLKFEHNELYWNHYGSIFNFRTLDSAMLKQLKDKSNDSIVDKVNFEKTKLLFSLMISNLNEKLKFLK